LFFVFVWKVPVIKAEDKRRREEQGGKKRGKRRKKIREGRQKEKYG
jgi:hypothetical protein